ncbi:hypothetical protein PRK78_007105 [Emydomyces testavorans]|uniref:Uncharacterized protein n=1 Tax=Emydomyces testavorans TaxID=2070801 RepID=A0AAF0DMN1_9EURO|nr:hypothetical protein PRK78_007105 [Emydomyces testavorans]
MAASYYYEDHPHDSRPAPTYPTGAYASNPGDDLVYDAHPRRHNVDVVRSSSAPKQSRHSGYYSSQGVEYPRHRRHRGRGDYRPRRSYSESSTSRSPSPKPRRRKSFSEQALAALGLGSSRSHGSKYRRTRSRDRSYDYYDSRSHRDYDHGRRRRGHRRRSRSFSSSPSPDRSAKEIRNAITAALTAGAAEAYRARKEPGGWTGEKGKRILTAAIGAGGIDKLIERNPSKHNKRHILESTIAGLATNHLMNGSRSRSRSRHGRRARSESHGGMKNLAATGVLAAAGKKAYDHYRSKSRDRSSQSGYSSDESSQPHRHHKKRSQSLTDYVTKGLTALGLADESDDKRRSKRHHGRYHGSSDDDDYTDGYRSHHPDKHSRRSG